MALNQSMTTALFFNEAVQKFVEQQCNLAARLWEAPSCVDFKTFGLPGGHEF